MTYTPEGRHLILDGVRAAPSVLGDGDLLADGLSRAARAAGFDVRNRFVERLHPGVSVILILAESHASIHTYPEHGAYMADVFTCGPRDPRPIADKLVEIVGGVAQVREIPRRPGPGASRDIGGGSNQNTLEP
jgi:spermidine synthase